MAYSFLFGGDTGETPASIKRKRDLAMAIMGGSAAPRNIGEGLNALGSGIVAGVMNRRADKSEKTGRDSANSAFQGIVNNITGQAPNVSASSILSTGVKPASGNASGGSGSYRDAIASIESAGSGDYSAVGPTHPKMGRALGRYGIMEANVGPWSREILGREVSADEFMANPKIQDAIFDGKFNSYVQKYGPEGAAQAWLGGEGGVGKVDRKDSLGTSIGDYGRRFMSQIGPQEVASLDPSIGMPPQTAGDAVNAMAGASANAGNGARVLASPFAPPSLSDEVAEFEKTPEYAARFPGQNVGVNAQPQQSAPPLAPPVEVASPAVPPNAPAVGQRQQVAQAQQMQPQAPQGPDQMTLLQALSNPWLSEEQRVVLQTLYQQQVQQAEAQREALARRQQAEYEAQLKQADPAYQLGLQKTRQEVESLKTPEYQTLTPEERKALGIPDTDQRVYQRSRGGKIDAVGGAGQTINVGNEVEARKAAAAQVGLTPDHPAYQGFILTGKLPREDAQALTATDKKAILEADEMVAANENALKALETAKGLSGKANAGWFSGTRASIGNNLPDWMVPDFVSSPESSEATTNFDNAVIGQALTSLKTIFGGNPTEGERKILLDLQGSSSLPKGVRGQILDRAIEMANRRLEFNRERAASLRGGDYYKPGGGKAKTNIGGYTIEEE
ncbi:MULTISPECIES: hypothetical protein [unclassified Sinorhizobium]|uniref:hypothetical protein n=1 Tax=unclassified Sinorhizobium TaxID=2613772 RepID=UPI0024C3FC7B|nr:MULTISPECIES: hypothetical protein [unclassified Sinorhizobium]MDK1377091.1 hypothetical protein [Sinorhizobium sp. 6-70]MDK1479614.1 hypothetical protein [Sinorhizobium sp. 6-117]